MRPNFFNDLSAPLPTSSDLQLFSCSLNFAHLFSPLLTSSHLSHLFSPLLHISSHSTLVSPLLVSPQLFSPFRTYSQSCLALAPLNFSHRLDFSRLISTLFSPLLVLPQLLSTFRARSQLLSPHFNSFLTPSRLVSALLNF